MQPALLENMDWMNELGALGSPRGGSLRAPESV